MAAVWRAHDALLGSDVALKVLDEKLSRIEKVRRRFLHEGQATDALDHPGIVKVIDRGESDGVTFIAFSLVDGKTVSDLIGERLLPIEEAARIVYEAADALGFAHGRGVLHRDVTSRNVMVGRDGRVFVLDFGLALAAWVSRVTSTEVALGTAAYMAPEVIRGEEANARSDLYGLGVVLYEALTGGFPFPGDRPHTVLFRALNLQPIPPRERRPPIPADLERVVLKAIAREPQDRYQRAAELVADLTPFLVRSSGVPTKAPSREVAGHAGHARLEDRSPGPIYLMVFHFDAKGSNGETEECLALARRLTESLSRGLAKIPEVHVVGLPERTASAETREPRALAQDLGANALLQGCVMRSASKLRVSYAVVDLWSSSQMAADVLDGSVFEPLELEERLIASVRRGLKLEPDHGEDSRARGPHDPAAQEHYRQAIGYLRRHDDDASVDASIRLLEGLIRSEGDEALYHAALARACLRKHELTREHVWEARAASSCARAQELEPDAPDVHLALGYLQISTGRHDAAIAEFAKALEQSPDLFEARLGTARALIEAGRLAEAEKACLELVRTHDRDWRGHHLLGRVYFDRGESSRAIEPLRRVVDLTPDNARAVRNLGTAFYRLDRFEDAVLAYRQSIEIQPHDEAYTNLGTVLYFLGRFDESIAALQKATELAPLKPHRWGNLGSACRWIPGQEGLAEQALRRAIALMRDRLETNPNVAESWAWLASWLANLGHSGEALEAIREALRLGPDNVRCIAEAVHVHAALGDDAECLRWLRRAIDAGYPAVVLARSPSLASLRANPEFQKLVGLEPGSRG